MIPKVPASHAALDAYRQVVGDRRIGELYKLAERLKGATVQHVSSTRLGGGVAEILDRLTPLMSELGLSVRWDVIEGKDEFWRVTKQIHNGLHGEDVNLGTADLDTYVEGNRHNAGRIDLAAEFVFVHDPQPLAMVAARRARGGKQKFVWRCHIDASAPLPRLWRFLETYVRRYDALVFSAPQFSRPSRQIQFLVSPTIDPLSPKNRPLPPAEIARVLADHGVSPRRPLLTQVSRFDRLKDPFGVMAAYRMVKETHDCQLVLAGGAAADDPESAQVLAEVQDAAAGDPDIFVLALPADSHLEINALQRASTVVFQKSIREGFGLTVAEALWKGRAVIGAATGGIPLQILDGVNGYLVYSPEGAAFRARYLLNHPELAADMGRRGIEMVRQNFILTRQLRDYLMVMLSLREDRRVVEL